MTLKRYSANDKIGDLYKCLLIRSLYQPTLLWHEQYASVCWRVLKREAISTFILFSAGLLNAFSNGVSLFPPVQICSESTPSTAACSFAGDTERQWAPCKVRARCSWGFQSVHIKKASVVPCAFTASQWKLTVAKGTNFILLLEEDMKTSLLKLMDLVYRADEAWIKKGNSTPCWQGSEGIYPGRYSLSFSFTFWDS